MLKSKTVLFGLNLAGLTKTLSKREWGEEMWRKDVLEWDESECAASLVLRGESDWYWHPSPGKACQLAANDCRNTAAVIKSIQ